MRTVLVVALAVGMLAGCSGPVKPMFLSKVYPAEEARFCSSMVRVGGVWRPDNKPGPIAVVYAFDDAGTSQRRAYAVMHGTDRPPQAPPPAQVPPPMLGAEATHEGAWQPQAAGEKWFWWEYFRGRWPMQVTNKVVAASSATTIIVMIEVMSQPPRYEQHRVVLVGEAGATSVEVSLFGVPGQTHLLSSTGPSDEWFVQTEIEAGVEVLKKYRLSDKPEIAALVQFIKAKAAAANLDKAF